MSSVYYIRDGHFYCNADYYDFYFGSSVSMNTKDRKILFDIEGMFINAYVSMEQEFQCRRLVRN